MASDTLPRLHAQREHGRDQRRLGEDGEAHLARRAHAFEGRAGFHGGPRRRRTAPAPADTPTAARRRESSARRARARAAAAARRRASPPRPPPVPPTKPGERACSCTTPFRHSRREIVIELQHRRSATTRDPRLHAVDDARQQRREQHPPREAGQRCRATRSWLTSQHHEAAQRRQSDDDVQHVRLQSAMLQPTRGHATHA